MQLFSFDKFWGLSWTKVHGYIYSCEFDGFIITANKEKVSSPRFALYRNYIADDNCIIGDLDSDILIMQMKSIRETKTIAVK